MDVVLLGMRRGHVYGLKDALSTDVDVMGTKSVNVHTAFVSCTSCERPGCTIPGALPLGTSFCRMVRSSPAAAAPAGSVLR